MFLSSLEKSDRGDHSPSNHRTSDTSMTDISTYGKDGRKPVQELAINSLGAGGEGEDAGSKINVTVEDPPDGGYWAWAGTIGGHLALMNTWGLNSSFGVFQSYYMQELNRSPDDISWIGSLQVFLLFFIGTLAGRLTDMGYFHTVFICGTLLTCLGIFMVSISTTYWQILLSQGICTGIGNGLLFTPALAIVGTYFKKHRSLAFGVTATGTATGGLIFPTMARQLLPQIGLPWTIRSMGLVQVVTLGIANMLLRPRLAPKRSNASFVDWAAFKDLSYTFFACGMFCAFWGMYFAFYYIAAFAKTQLDPRLDYINSLNVLLVVNGVGYIGRFVPNLFADRHFGPVTLMIPCSLVSGVCLLAWMSVGSPAGLYAWAAVYGIAAGGVQSLFPAGLTKLTADVHKTGVRMGMICTTNSISTLTGPPIAGAIIRATSGSRYINAQVFAGLSLLVGTGFFVAARCVALRNLGLSWKANI